MEQGRAGDSTIADDVAALTRKARDGQWSPEAAIDWGLPVRKPPWLSHRAYLGAVSQLRHAERATAAACARLEAALPEAEARAFLALQAVDEARHVAVYDRYLARLGALAPVDPGFGRALDGALAWTGSPCGLILAFHVVLEAEAVKLQGDVAAWFPCPLLRRITALIARDEARHVAFGRIYLSAHLPALDAAERARMHRWLRGLWQDCVGVDRDGMRRRGLFGRLGAEGLARRWRAHEQALLALGLGA